MRKAAAVFTTDSESAEACRTAAGPGVAVRDETQRDRRMEGRHGRAWGSTRQALRTQVLGRP